VPPSASVQIRILAMRRMSFSAVETCTENARALPDVDARANIAARAFRLAQAGVQPRSMRIDSSV
jgi:hypothetical protein